MMKSVWTRKPVVGSQFWALVVACALAGCATEASIEAAADGTAAEWRQNAVWDDGNAEFCAYEIDWFRYGRLFPGRALLISVKEPWAPDLEVKADRDRPDGFDVIKLNHVRDVDTGIYTYHQMASAFMHRDSGALRKLSVTSSEGCGISTAHVVGGEINTRSYFDGQGEATGRYPDGAQPADGLALFLRDMVSSPAPPKIDVFPSLMTGRFPRLESETHEVARSSGRQVVPAGTFKTVEIELRSAASWMRFSFDAESPHALIRYEDSQGTEYRLAKCERIPYWEMNRPGGEEWLPESAK